jgi:Fe2+ transport system protein FeoA
MMPLDMLRAGEIAQVTDVAGEQAFVCRLAELGVREGCTVCILQPGSPCLLDVAGSRVGLRPADCSRILVRPVGAMA